MREDLAIILSHFNWCGYKRPDQNLNRFLRYMDSLGVPVYGAEASLNGDFITKGKSNWIQIGAREENVCFQKEALLNAVEKIVPEKYTKLAWLDHDIYFDNQNWYDDTSIALEDLNIVQTYETAHWTDSRGNIERTAKSILSQPVLTESNIISPFWTMTPTHHCGFGFAAKRSLWKEVGGLYPYNFLGSGDMLMIHSILSPDPTPASCRTAYFFKPENASDFFKTWKAAFNKYAGNKYGAVKGTIYHEYHGPRQNRKYGAREKIIEAYGYNFAANIWTNYRGLLELKNPPYGFTEAIKQYFIERREDDMEEIKIDGINTYMSPH